MKLRALKIGDTYLIRNKHGLDIPPKVEAFFEQVGYVVRPDKHPEGWMYTRLL